MNARLHLRLACLLAFAAPAVVRAWDEPGHRMVNQLALASLPPPDFPAWIHEPAYADRIAFLAGEPDRWRNSRNAAFLGYNGMDHYIDMEQLTDAGIALDTLTPFRYQFAAEYAAGRLAHPDRFPAIDPAKDQDHSREWPGFLPWAISEYYAKLQSEFSYLKTFERYGTPEEVAEAKANVAYVMGVMGHFVGDGSQPLHVTVHHHGWVGPNPNGYTTRYSIHGWIDGGFIAKAGIKLGEIVPMVVPAQPLDVTIRADGRDAVFVDIFNYLRTTETQTEPLYRLEKDHKLDDAGPGSQEGREFIKARLLAGGEELGAIWLTAWRQAAPDTYLQSSLIKRSQAAAAAHP
jgi:hypothetical protein